MVIIEIFGSGESNVIVVADDDMQFLAIDRNEGIKAHLKLAIEASKGGFNVVVLCFSKCLLG